jgi:uncharacterized protein YpmS
VERPSVHIYTAILPVSTEIKIYFTVKPYDKLALTFSVMLGVKFISLGLLSMPSSSIVQSYFRKASERMP